MEKKTRNQVLVCVFFLFVFFKGFGTLERLVLADFALARLALARLALTVLLWKLSNLFCS